MIRYPCNLYRLPSIPHFYIVKVGFTWGYTLLYPRKLCLWGGILFSHCPNESVSVTFCFLNILKSH